MAKFNIPETVKYNYMDLNNLQGMDSWDTNPSPMRASDMLNIVKKEGLHQTRHNVIQSYITGYRKLKNILLDSIFVYDEDTNKSSMYINANFEPDTTYTLSFVPKNTQKMKLNDDLFVEEGEIDLIGEQRIALTLTTKEVLPEQTSNGYLILMTDETTSDYGKLTKNKNYKIKSIIAIETEDLFNNVLNTINLLNSSYGSKDYLSKTRLLYGSNSSEYLNFMKHYVYNIMPSELYLETKNSFGDEVICKRTIKNYERSSLNQLTSSLRSQGLLAFIWTLTSSGSEKCNVKIYSPTSIINLPVDASDTFYFKIKPSFTYNNTDNGSHSFGYSLKVIDILTNKTTGESFSKETTIGSKSGSISSGTASIVTELPEYKYILNKWIDKVTHKTLKDNEYERTLNYMATITVDGSSWNVGYDRYPSSFTDKCPVFPKPVDYVDEILKTKLIASSDFNVTSISYSVDNYITVEGNNINNDVKEVQLEEGSVATDYTQPITSKDDDLLYDIKYIGKIEEYDEKGNPVPYYIKISEYLGELNKENDSEIVISVHPTPLVKNANYSYKETQGFEKYLTSSKIFPFTNYGKSGNRQGLYEHIEFDGKERVFTPIGILSFNCSTTETEDGYYQLNFEVENVLDNPYVPTIGYGSTPNGLDYSTYEAINLLSDKRKFQFLSDGTSKEYQLPETNLEDYCKIQILQDNGVFVELNDGFSLNKTKGTITFNTAPSKSPIDGKDNIIVEYAKKPTSAVEANDFTLNAISSDNVLKADIKIVKSANIDDNTKINAQLEISIGGGSSFDKSIYTINSANLKIVAGDIEIYNVALTDEQLSTINSGASTTISKEVVFNNDGAVENRRWTASINADYTKNTYKQTTTSVAGSKEGDKSIDTQRKTGLGFNWIGLEYNAKAVATVGSKTDGSDSYWDVYVWVRLWVSKASYLQTQASTLYGVVDGSRVEAGSTCSMYGSSTVYPSNGLSVRKRIPYSSSKKSVSIGAYLKFGTTTNLSGVNCNEMSVGDTTLNLPSITLPKTVTTTSGEKTNGSTTASTSFNETIVTGKDTIVKYDNVVPGSARLACYYGAKCVTVYGYESDRRVFLSDGTNCDTYSGATLDGSSSITYFPDTNYRVLGEDTEIIGYSQKDGYLFTFKRGDDSVYVRYGTTLNDITEFPSAVVTRNLQVLARPIQINDEILLITREGIKGMSYISQECRTELRSYFISNYFKLSADYDYDKMQWFKDDSLLHIFLNEYEFTADMVSKSYVQEGTATTGGRYSSTLAFQYEWYVNKIDWLGNEPPCVNVYQPKDFERQSEGIVYEYQREIGYNNKGVFEFSYNDNKVDKIQQIIDGEVKTIYKPIKAHYITPFLNMGAINVAKTVKYVYINTRSKNNDMFAIGYIDENGYQETLQKVYNNIGDFRTKLKNSEIPFPKLIQIKSKIRKFMNIKLYVQNRAELEDVDTIDVRDESLYGNTTFDRILVQYQIAGKYRGE